MGQVMRLHPDLRVRVGRDEQGRFVRVMNGTQACAKWLELERRPTDFMAALREADILAGELGLEIELPSPGEPYRYAPSSGRRRR